MRVRGRDEFVEVNLLSSGQPFVKANRIPRVNGLLGVGKGDGAKQAEFSKRALDNRLELISRHRSGRQAHRGGFVARELAAGKDKVGGALATIDCARAHGGTRRLA